ncbi:MAG: hypothetical protein ACRC7J_13040, partial [Vibrio ordalii]|uniref:hypothetical protein n=1 Tax=Vibrio ordalii TaxID=28174 RepID=UPI003F3F8B77
MRLAKINRVAIQIHPSELDVGSQCRLHQRRYSSNCAATDAFTASMPPRTMPLGKVMESDDAGSGVIATCATANREDLTDWGSQVLINLR